MTEQELEKEAERIADYFTFRAESPRRTREVGFVIDALRAIATQSHNAAIEQAAKISDARVSDRYSADCGVEAEIISDEVRALKISPDGSGIGDGK